MIKKLIILTIALMSTACSITFIYVEKNMYIEGDKNESGQFGSELKDNNATQTSDGTLEIPLVK